MTDIISAGPGHLRRVVAGRSGNSDGFAEFLRVASLDDLIGRLQELCAIHEIDSAGAPGPLVVVSSLAVPGPVGAWLPIAERLLGGHVRIHATALCPLGARLAAELVAEMGASAMADSLVMEALARAPRVITSGAVTDRRIHGRQRWTASLASPIRRHAEVGDLMSLLPPVRSRIRVAAHGHVADHLVDTAFPGEWLDGGVVEEPVDPTDVVSFGSATLEFAVVHGDRAAVGRELRVAA